MTSLFFNTGNVLQVEEWLCLNCQMQRALGGAAPSGPPMAKAQPSKQPPSSPQKNQSPASAQLAKSEPTRTTESKKPSPLVKQQSTMEATPPSAAKTSGPTPEQAKPTSKQEAQKPAEQPGPAGGKPPTTSTDARPLQPAGPAQDSSKQPAQHQEQPPAADPKVGQPAQDTGKPKQESGFFGLSLGGLSEAAKPKATSPQPTESVSGKMFGFSSSIFSSASNLMSSAVQEESAAQKPAEPPGPGATAAPKEAVPVQPSAKATPATEAKSESTQKQEQAQVAEGLQPVQEKKPADTIKAGQPVPGLSKEAPKASAAVCPLCKTALNVGSEGPPNYNTCTECKNTVCNLCGFNPMPHLAEVRHKDEFITANEMLPPRLCTRLVYNLVGLCKLQFEKLSEPCQILR